MTVGTAFHPRTAPLIRARSVAPMVRLPGGERVPRQHVIEYAAVRDAAALFDVSPLFKYECAAPTPRASSTG